MKGWSFRIATLGGTEVRIHFTFFLLLAFFFWGGLSQGGMAEGMRSLIFIVAIFLCVLLHEFGHVLAAKRYGIQTPDITLLPIGGVARLERMPREPGQELVVAICGPLVNVVIASLIGIGLHLWPNMNLEFDPAHGNFWVQLMVWNRFMVLFNLIPAFPMDGGRVLRAVLAFFMDYGRATRVAASVGQTIAMLGFMAALFFFHNPMLLIIALFIFLGAGQEAAMVTEEESTRGLRVRNAMVTEFHSLREDAMLREAVDLLLSGTQHDFPVVDASGKFSGLLSRTSLIAALAEHGAQHPVREAMQVCEVKLGRLDPLNEALTKLHASGFPALPVLDPNSEEPVGLLTAENIAEMLMVRAALEGNADAATV
jgi:Zn-dependent protease/CBS domain-containing protein